MGTPRFPKAKEQCIPVSISYLPASLTELYEPLPGFILSQAAAIGATEPPAAPRDHVESFVKAALAQTRTQHVDRV
jgi:hypothetical protein